MTAIDDIFNMFLYHDISIDETLVESVIKFQVKTIKINWNQFIEKLCQIPTNDEIIISFKLSTDCFFDIIHYKECAHNTQDYIDKSNELMELCDCDDYINITININKSIKDGVIPIYFYDVFINWFLKKNLIDIMNLFSRLYEDNLHIKFICYNKDITLITDTLIFVKDGSEIQYDEIDRSIIIKDRLQICNIYNNSELNLIPDDFNIKLSKNIDERVVNIFFRIKNILSLMHISDMSEIKENSLIILIKGYRNCNYQIDLDELECTNNSYLYKIYKWIYNEGNIYDKVILARNMISLHCRYKKILDVDSDTFNSIKSNYGFYLKQNTDDFLDKKREFTISITEKCSEISENIYSFSKNLKTNFMAFFTYLATLIISNSFSNGRFEDIFTKEVTLLTLIVILGSAIFFFMSLDELNDKNKNVNIYIRTLKQAYSNLFEENELESLINKNEIYVESKVYFKKNRLLITVFWVLFIIISTIVLNYLSEDFVIEFLTNIQDIVTNARIQILIK